MELQGAVGADVELDCNKGVAEVIVSASDIKIVRSRSSDFTHSKGKR